MTVKSKTTKTFRRQFLELASGSSLAQVFSLILMPVISRLYSPHEMGDYALYVSISSIAGVLATLRLDQAVILAADDEEAACLVWSSIASAAVIGLISLPLLLLMHQTTEFCLATSLSTAAIGIVQTMINWHSRQARYRLLASRSAGEKLVVLGLGIWLGWWGYTHFGLIAAQTIGSVYSVTYLTLTSRLQVPRFVKAYWLQTLHKFADFPRKNFFSIILLASSMYLPSILFAAVFSRDELGQYNLANRLFEIPINLIAFTFSTVYYQHSSTLEPAQRLRLFWRSLRWLALVFVPLFAIAGIFGPQLFKLVFGVNWIEAGHLARFLAPLTAVRLFFISQGSLLLVQRKLNLDLFISFMLFAAQIGGFLIGYWGYGSLTMAVVAMASLGTFVYIIGLGLVRFTLKN